MCLFLYAPAGKQQPIEWQRRFVRHWWDLAFSKAMTVAFYQRISAELVCSPECDHLFKVDHSRRRNREICCGKVLSPSLLNVRERTSAVEIMTRISRNCPCLLGSEITAIVLSNPRFLGCVSGRPYSGSQGDSATVAMACRSDIRLETTESSLPAFAPIGVLIVAKWKAMGLVRRTAPGNCPAGRDERSGDCSEVDMALLESLFQGRSRSSVRSRNISP